MLPLEFKIGLLRAGVQMQTIARKKKVAVPFVSMNLAGKRNSKKTQEIRDYASLIQRKAA